MISLLNFANSRETETTKKRYTTSLCSFFEAVYYVKPPGKRRDPEHVRHMDELSIQYINEKRDYLSDLLSYSSSMSNLSPNTRSGNITTAIYWLELNDIVLKRAQRDFIKTSAGSPETVYEDHTLTHEEIKRWYEHLSRFGRVILLVQLASAMRIGEILGLEPEDVDLEKGIVYVRRSGPRPNKTTRKKTKNKKPRITFLTPEAIFAVKEWLKYHDTYVEQVKKKFNFKQAENYNPDRLFPTSQCTVEHMFNLGLKKAGLYEKDPNVNRATISSHSIRRFCMSQLKLSMPIEMVEMIAGHSGYLSDEYRRYDIDLMKKEYDKAYYAISLHSSENIPEIKAELESSKNSLQYVTSALLTYSHD